MLGRRFRRLSLSPRFLKFTLSISIAFFAYLLLPADCPEPARRTVFIFALAAFFWALEVIPVYATSLVVVLLSVLLLAQPGGVLQMDRAGYKVFLNPFASPVIMLFLGGFAIAGAFRKYRLDVRIARRLLGYFGNRPYFILLGFMAVTAFFSMWMSNTATAAMMIAMVIPLLGRLAPGDPFRAALVLGVAFGGNIGGIGTPIGTPPNAIAIGLLAENGIYLNFLSWMLIGVPLAAGLILVSSGVLYKLFPPHETQLDFLGGPPEKKDPRSRYVLAIAGLTVFLWLTSGFHRLPESVVALLAAALLTVSGLLDRHDLKKIDWDILILMWGGLTLGSAIQLSGLADWVVGLPVFHHRGFWLVAVFALAGVVLSTFISNTATANLLIPIALSFPGQDPVFLAVAIALCCSFAMALPISTPPNAIAFSTEAVRSHQMLKAGLIVSALSVGAVLAGFRTVVPWIFGASS